MSAPLRPVLVALSEGRTFKTLEKETTVDPSNNPLTQRSHGRALCELPPLFFALESHPNHTGSAFFSIGDTRVSAAISGPHPRVTQQSNRASRGQKDAVVVTACSRLDATLELSLQLAPFALANTDLSLTSFLSEHLEEAATNEKKSDGQPTMLSALGDSVMETLRSTIRTSVYPHTTIEIAVLILSYDESLLFPAVINTVSLALMDAGIACSDVLAACVSYVVQLPSREPFCCLALDDEELNRIKRSGGELTSITIASLTGSGLIAYIDMTGRHLQPPYDQQSLALAESACLAIAKEMGNCARSQ